ncbi:hypothetical protein H2200_009007 [Cladophialophora chaetospira]|uniref:Major facilitator superfamily (MFS) profile domain-containing protein n=1 Tax=Cladophialophora chaetospira TaxID=386627 RepID=A0AA38X554_9EURO|nr:hypothetical protein H2200_009007 [Cladophialophora chaetospira]
MSSSKPDDIALQATAVSPATLSQPESWNPHNWSPVKKAYISVGIVLASFTPIVSNSAYVASVYGVQARFQVSITVSLLRISLYAIGFAVGPALASTASELFGRQWLIKGSLFLCLIFTVVSGSATTFRTMIVARGLAGISVSASITPLLGVCNDLYNKEQEVKRDTLISFYGIAQLWASVLGPTIGESIVTSHGGEWRWTFWLIAILLGTALLWLLPLPETHKPEMRQKSARRQDLQGRNTLSILIKMLMVEQIVLPCALMVALNQTIFFVLYVAIPVGFGREYHFSNYHIGLCFLAFFVGSVIGLVFLRVCDVRLAVPKERQRLAAASGDRFSNPRERLYGAMIGVILQPISLFWFAWTCRHDIHWIVPLLSLVFFGMAYVLLQLGVPMYKNVIYAAQFGASALAPDLMLRFGLSSSFPLFTPHMIDKLTFGWTISLFAFLSIPVAVLPFVIYRHGDKMLERSKYLRSSQNNIE